MKKMKFGGYDCNVLFREYENGRVAIKLVDANDGTPITTATINLPDEWLEKGQVFVKDYAENEGMAKALLNAGIVEKEVERIPINDWGSEVAVMTLNPDYKISKEEL